MQWAVRAALRCVVTNSSVDRACWDLALASLSQPVQPSSDKRALAMVKQPIQIFAKPDNSLWQAFKTHSVLPSVNSHTETSQFGENEFVKCCSKLLSAFVLIKVVLWSNLPYNVFKEFENILWMLNFLCGSTPFLEPPEGTFLLVGSPNVLFFFGNQKTYLQDSYIWYWLFFSPEKCTFTIPLKMPFVVDFK